MRRNKYGNKRVKLDGYSFESKAEARYYGEMKLLEQAHIISGLVVHPKYPIVYKGTKVCVVELDFEYCDADGVIHFVDVKGQYLPMSRLKHKLFKAFYGEEVTIVRDKR